MICALKILHLDSPLKFPVRSFLNQTMFHFKFQIENSAQYAKKLLICQQQHFLRTSSIYELEHQFTLISTVQVEGLFNNKHIIEHKYIKKVLLINKIRLELIREQPK